MQPPVIVEATMIDGTVIRDVAETFAEFVKLALPYFHDRDCVCLVWYPPSCSGPVRELQRRVGRLAPRWRTAA